MNILICIMMYCKQLCGKPYVKPGKLNHALDFLVLNNELNLSSAIHHASNDKLSDS